MAAKADKLTRQQELFIQALLRGLTQRVAYRLAYPKSLKWTDNTVDVRASKLFKIDKVFIRYTELSDRLVKEAEEESIFTVKEVLREIKDLLNTNITDIVEIRTEEVMARDGLTNEPILKDDGTAVMEWVQNIRMKDTEDMTPAALKSISEIGYNRFGIYVKRYDKQKTIDQAGRHLGLFTDKLEVKVTEMPKIVFKRKG